MPSWGFPSLHWASAILQVTPVTSRPGPACSPQDPLTALVLLSGDANGDAPKPQRSSQMLSVLRKGAQSLTFMQRILLPQDPGAVGKPRVLFPHRVFHPSLGGLVVGLFPEHDIYSY